MAYEYGNMYEMGEFKGFVPVVGHKWLSRLYDVSVGSPRVDRFAQGVSGMSGNTWLDVRPFSVECWGDLASKAEDESTPLF